MGRQGLLAAAASHLHVPSGVRAALHPYCIPTYLPCLLPARPAGVSITNICCILFILAAGFPRASTHNLSPFLPYGVHGMFSAASMV